MSETCSHLNDLQKAGFNILKVFIEICNRHSLKYYVYGGTMLGAIRHKGFIPWDDDVDVAMPRKDFEKFKEFQSELPEYMFLDTIQRKGHYWTPAQIRDTRMMVEAGYSARRGQMGVWLDILIIDGVPNPGTLKYKLYSFIYLSARLLYKFSHFSDEVSLVMERPWYERCLVKFAMFTHIEKIINQQLAGRYLDWVSRWYDMDSCDYVATLAGPKKMEETQPKSWFGNGREMLFEDIMVKIMDEGEKFCVKFYGKDYMTPPPIDKRGGHAMKIVSVEYNQE